MSPTNARPSSILKAFIPDTFNFSLGVESITSTMLCCSCQSGFRTQRALKEHLMKHHSCEHKNAAELCVVLSDISAANQLNNHPLRDDYFSASNCVGKNSPTMPLSPLQGLKIYEGFKCIYCTSLSKTSQWFQRHLLLNHSVPTEKIKDVIENSKVQLQILHGNQNDSLFVVSDNDDHIPMSSSISDVIESGHVHSLITTPEKGNVSELVSPNRNDLSKGKDVERETTEDALDRTLPNEIYSHISNMIRFPLQNGLNEKEEETDILNDFIERVQFHKILEEENISLKEAVFLCDRSSSPLEMRIMDTLKHYFRDFARLQMEVAPAVLREIDHHREKEIFRAVSPSSSDRYVCSFVRFVLFTVRLQQFKQLDNDLNIVLRSTLPKFDQTSVEMSTRTQALHELLREIGLNRLPLHASPSKHLVRLFLACSSVKSDDKNMNSFRFLDAKEASPTLSALLYGICGIALTEITALKHISDPIVVDSRMKDVLSCTDVEANTTLSFVRCIMNICSAQTRMKTVDMSFTECSSHSNCGFVDGLELSMSTLGKAVQCWQREARDVLQKDLLGNFIIGAETMGKLHQLTDDLENRARGFSFLSHPPNKPLLEAITTEILIHLCNPNSLPVLFSSPSEECLDRNPVVLQLFGSKLTFRRRAIEMWLQSCQRVQERLLSAIHLSSGSPARGTEVCTLQLRNTTSQQRSFYISQGDILIIQRYGKMRRQSGGDRLIARFPDEETRNLLLVYLGVLRPIEALFVEALFGCKERDSHLDFLFVHRGIRYKDSKVRVTVKEMMEKQSIPHSFSQIRDFSVAMVRVICDHDIETKNSAISMIAHHQAGHTVDTADRNYGRSDADMPSLGATTLQKYRLWSSIWQETLGLTSSSSRTERRSEEVPLDTKGLSMQKLISDISRPIQEKISMELKSIMKNHQKPLNIFSKAEQDQDLSLSKRRKTSHYGNPSFTKRNKAEDVAKFLPEMRKMMNDDGAKFKSQVQADATALIFDRYSDLLLILPTGAGKTLCVLLPVYAERSIKTTIVITPLVALKEEWISRANQYGITTGMWENRNSSQVDLFVISAEHVGMTEFRKLVGNLHSEGRLGRIIVDEAHLTMEWSDFRPSLDTMSFIFQSLPHEIPKILLSATVVPSCREELLNVHGATRNAVVLSVPTVRKNLKLVIERVLSKQFQTIEGQMLQSLIRCFHRCQVEMENIGGHIIIYVLRKNDITLISDALEALELSTDTLGMNLEMYAYHTGMPLQERKDAHQNWGQKATNSIKVMVCTSAFGCGVDCSTVRYVFHFGGSTSLTSFSQEIGRAGRDGHSAESIVIFSSAFSSRFEKIVGKTISGDGAIIHEATLRGKVIAYQNFTQWCETRTGCRKSDLYIVMDGVDPGMCLYDSSSLNCDLCEAHEILPDLVQLSSVQVLDRREDMNPPPPRDVMPNNVPNTSLEYTSELECRNFYKSSLTRFREISKELQDLCIYRLVRNGVEMLSRNCNRSCACNSACHRCALDTHYAKECILPSWHTGLCYICGLNRMEGQEIHSGDFGRKTCSFKNTRLLCWLLWNCSSKREEIMSALMTQQERNYTVEQLEKGKGTEAFDSWLRMQRQVPNQIRIALWWKDRTIIH